MFDLMTNAPFSPIAPSSSGGVRILDQTRLPGEVVWLELSDVEAAAEAIRVMRVRGAPLIGITAAYGVWLALEADAGDACLAVAIELLMATRPTGVNLRRVLEDVAARVAAAPESGRAALARQLADRLREEDVATNRAIGEHGLRVILELVKTRPPGEPVHILTHCNAGALATAGYGTATAPMYRAAEQGVPLHVWIDETRPRNQGASLTAWELGRAGIPHTVVVDNAGGHLMQNGLVDLCLVGTDRTLVSGDVCNKIGTYLKALSAHDNDVPFYAAVPGLSIDWQMREAADVPIEERDGAEVAELSGVRLVPPGTPVANFAFDVTPARLVTGLITERGVCEASEAGLRALYPEGET